MRWVCLLALLACEQGNETTTPSATTAPSIQTVSAIGPMPWKAAAIAHGGVGTPPEKSDGCRKAVDAALAKLDASGDPLDAVVAGVAVMEDDPRYNAGTGSRVRIDGETVQMDASVMDSSGQFGAVAVIERVRYPAQVARAVIDTPHVLLAGDGATRFARQIGLPDYEPATSEMKTKTAELQKLLLSRDPTLPRDWQTFDYRRHWNFEKTLAAAGLDESDTGTDTVGVAVRTSDGRFAVALSTGGTSITLRGRVGDVPIFGAGLYAGTHGAVAATGSGERIIEFNLGRRVDEWLRGGYSPREAANLAVSAIRPRGAIGVIVIGSETMAAQADRPMAWAGREAGSDQWQGPDPGK